MSLSPKPILLVGNAVSAKTVQELTDSGRFEVLDASSIGKFGSDEPFVELMKGKEDDFAANLNKLKGAKAYILQSTAEPVSDNTMHLLLMAHTLKQYGAAEVTALVPFTAFMRQDRSFKNRFTSVAADMFAKQLKAAGVDRIATVTPHSKGGMQLYQHVFGEDFIPVPATDVFAEDIKRRFTAHTASLSIGAPDGADKAQDEGQNRARELAKAVFGHADDSAMFRIAKTHTGVSDTKIVSFDGDVKDKDCVIVDDMIDGGSTMVNAASLLKAHGAKSVTCYATHGILTGNALEKILLAKPDGMNPAIDKLIITDSIPDAQKKLDALLAKQPSLKGRVEILPVGNAMLKELDIQALTAAPAVQRRRRFNGPAQ
ncbi:MAG: ribose-phosphate diphosphokinase [Micavibrio sp.]|nr:ribose-phosphate diphosphokinase [Micavibrio sp.]